MTEYLLLIHGNENSPIPDEEWARFLTAAHQSGMFAGGSEVGRREFLGNAASARSSEHIVGFMRFDAVEKSRLLDLLKIHPVVVHGGSVELCELPRS